ncbi:MFS transporter, PPP family, 3-phenylpropionic acid transporter [Devosia sp. YR412]|uniref:MFS transporter n=1 Tax=Devosia sp. YR412 TaxID=1881030 RepID=UPI0008B8C018|nr:MFS transporter [Devosia sp. YR412]SEP99575.1 MFS transporter, PPP family, 3-phenylpropionic acid transporter [Devosia sp. YR412]
MPSALSRSASPELRASLFQFTVYLPGAVSSVFLGIWLSEHGIPADQIGLVNSIPILVLLALNTMVGRIADRARDWRYVIMAIALFGATVPFALHFVSDFWGIVLVWTLCTFGNGSIPPLIDAATVRMTRRTGGDFGQIRVWATVGYVVGAGGLGLLLTVFGADAFVPLFIAMALFRAIASLLLPRFRTPGPKVTLADATPSRLKDSLQLWFVLPLIAFALVNSGNAVIGGFGALVWEQGGVPSYFIGPLLAIAATAEAIMMFGWRRFGGRVTARNMILAACIASLIRFTVTAFNPPVAVLFAVQMLHAVSFGVGYLGTVHFVANWTEESNAAEAQGFANMLLQGASFVMLTLFGWLVVHFGSASFLLFSALSFVAMACVLVSLRLKPPKDAQ